MSSKKKFNAVLSSFALIISVLLLGFGILNIFKQNQVLALSDEFNFFVATTPIKQTQISIDENGKILPAYITDENNKNYGFNYLTFSDYLQVQKNYGFNANQDIFVLVNNNYIKLIFGEDENGNVYGSDRVSKVANKEAFDLENGTYYVNTGGQFIEITTNNLFIENLLQPYSYSIYKLVNGDTGATFERYNNEIKSKSSDNSSAFLPNYYSNNVENLYIEVSKEYALSKGSYKIAKTTEVDNKEVIQVQTDETDGKYYIPLYDEVLASNLSATQQKFVTLDNYKAKQNLINGFTTNENVESIYLSIGSAYLEGLNTNFNRITRLDEVSITLQNQYYSSLRVLAEKPILQTLDSGNSNYFWYQYIDLENVRYKENENIENSNTILVKHPEGLYTFVFSGQYTTADGKATEFNFKYEVYLNKTSNITSFPDFNTLLKSNDKQYFDKDLDENSYKTYFYNFQTQEFPTYTFDASRYNLSVNQTINLVETNYTYDFKSLYREETKPEVTDFNAKEKALITEYINGARNKETLIVAEKRTLNISEINSSLISNDLKETISPESEELAYQNVYVYSYIYKSRTSGFDAINYLSDGWGNFEYKLTSLIFEKETTDEETGLKTKTYIIKHYKTTDIDKVSESDIMLYLNSSDLIKKEKIEYSQNLTVKHTTENEIGILTTYKYGVLETGLFDGENENDITGYKFSLTNNLTRTVITKEANNKVVLSIQNPYGVTEDNFNTLNEYLTLSEHNQIQTDEKGNKPTYKNVISSPTLDNLSNFDAFRFNYEIVYSELGVFTLENRYTLGIKHINYDGGDLNATLNNAGLNNISFVVDLNATNTVYDFKNEYKYKILVNDTEEIRNARYRKYGYTLHIFGIKSYFNKNEKTEFKNVSEGIYSDLTENVNNRIKDEKESILSILSNGNLATTSKTITLKADAKLNDALRPIGNVPVTNMTPITFDFFGLYSFNGLVPISRYYVYDFDYDEDGKPYITSSTPRAIKYFTKDDQPSESGYYEIIAEYKYNIYDDIFNNLINTKFYQVFAFVIDKSNPKTTYERLTTVIDTPTTSHNAWEKLVVSKDNSPYTNDAVRITWSQNSYFQYDIIPYFQKTNFDDIIVGMNGSRGTSDYEQLKTATTTKYAVGYTITNPAGIQVFKQIVDINGKPLSMQKYANSGLYLVPVFDIYFGETLKYKDMYPLDFLNSKLVDELEKEENVRYVYKKDVNQVYVSKNANVTHYVNLETPETSSIALWGSGIYNFHLKYGFNNGASLTQKFVFDYTDLTGLKVLPVNLDSNSITSAFDNNTSNLITKPFTFVYDKRPSGSSITTTYTAIPFKNNNDILRLFLSDNLEGISGTQNINPANAIQDVSYEYDYSFFKFGDSVYNKNIFKPSSSMLYIFNLTDTAGNTSKYFVAFDVSNPNFFLDVEGEDSFIEKYGIITDFANISWGNYKAINITNSNNLSDTNLFDKFIFGNGINYEASSLETMLRDVYKNNSNYSGMKLTRVWSIKTLDGDRNIEIEKEFINEDGSINLDKVYTKTISGKLGYYIDSACTKALVLGNNGKPLVSYYFLIPIRNVNFQYYNTNSDDSNIYSFNYSTDATGVLAKNSTYLSPTKKALASKFGVNVREIEQDVNHEYGFYGEKKYIYVITDLLGNECGNTLWMNLDFTLAMSFGSFDLTDEKLNYSPNMTLYNLTTYSSYSISQLYFSWLVDDKIPKSRIDYKFYDFDTDFYANYIITNVTYNDVTNEYTFKFTNKSDKSTKDVVISDKKLNNYNADDEEVNEPNSIYPFALNSERGWQLIVNNSQTDSKNNSSYYDASEKRYYSNIINPASKGSTNYECTKNGLYVFRRTYTDYIDANGLVKDSRENLGDGLKNDTVYRYYVYYVDTNGIIDLTNISNLNFILGAGMNDADYENKSFNEQTINNRLEKASTKDVAYSSMKVSNLFLTNRELVQFNLSMDKYNQAVSYNNFIDRTDYNDATNIVDNYDSAGGNLEQGLKNAQTRLTYLINRFVYGIGESNLNVKDFDAKTYYNQRFLMRLTLTFGTSTQLIGIKEGKTNLISPDKNLSENYLLNSLNNRSNDVSQNHPTGFTDRSTLKDGIILNRSNAGLNSNLTYNYKVLVADSSGITEGADMSKWNMFANDLTLEFGIDYSTPKGYYFGKSSSAEYESSANGDYDYAYALFNDITESLSTTNLENLNDGATEQVIGDKTVSVLTSTNNDTLIFVFEKAVDKTDAEIEPNAVTVTRTLPNGTPQVIFKVELTTDAQGNTTQVFTSSMGYTTERLKQAFLSNAGLKGANSKADKWAIVVFDNYNKNYKKDSALSDPSINATYEISIQYKGLSSDYLNNDGTKSNFIGNYQITVDNTKPLYNLIYLMENDKFIPRKTGTSGLPSGYLDSLDNSGYTSYIERYYDNLKGTPLDKQYAIEQIYNYYIESYYTYQNDKKLAYQDLDGNAYLTPNNEPIYKTYIQNYFFGVTKNFELKSGSSDFRFDSNRIYYREISNPRTYRFTLTPDDFPTAEDKNRVNELSLYEVFDSSRFEFAENSQFIKNGVGKYFEIVEEDEAGNYRVYAIYVADDLSINYSYAKAKNSKLNDKDLNGTLNNVSNSVDVYGTNLELQLNTNSDKVDKFLKAEIYVTYSASEYQYGTNKQNYKATSPITLYLDPINAKIMFNSNGYPIELPEGLSGDLSEIELNNYPAKFLEYITKICDIITSNNAGVADFNLSIKITSRTSENLAIEYYYPGEMLKYVKNGYIISIPSDTEFRSTKITSIQIAKYETSWKTLTRDFSPSQVQIPDGEWLSLGGRSFTLTNGTFRIILTDNFGRVATYYETWNASSVNHGISYSGKTQSLNGETYTAKTTSVTFDPSRYNPVVIVEENNGNKVIYTDFENINNYYKITSTTSSTNQSSVNYLRFNQDDGYWSKFTVILLSVANLNIDLTNIDLNTFNAWFEENKNSIENATYSFILYTKLPEIQLKNLHGGIIAKNNGQIFIEDLAIVWNERYLDDKTVNFNAKLNLRRYYNKTNYNSVITTNNYRINLPGDYFISLINDLDYTSEEIRFTRAEGNTILYSIYSVTSNGYSTQLSESSYTEVFENETVYNYYALDNFNNYDSTGSPIKSRDHIDIVTNTNNGIVYEFINKDENSKTYLFRIYKLSNDGTKITFRFVRINFITKTSGNFSGLRLIYSNNIDGTTVGENISYQSNTVKSTKDLLYILFTNENTYNEKKGNSIFIEHYFNGILVDSMKMEDLQSLNGIYSDKDKTKEYLDKYLSISSGGIHKFVVKDLAGNVSKFNGIDYLNIYLINQIVFNINNEEPLNGQIFNDKVYLEVLTKLEGITLYDSFNIEVYKNSVQITPEITALNTYKFSESGYYFIKITADVQLSSDLQKETISSEFNFKIVNPKTTLHTFDISSGNNFKVLSVEKKIEMTDDTDYVILPLTSYTSLWLSAEDEATGTGFYRITLQGYIESIKQYRQFSFNVWLSSATPTITSSIEFGTSTTDPITLSYNAKSIYEAIGESKILINDMVIAEINADSVDKISTITLTYARDYWVQIYTADDKLVASYKVTKKEPLNSNAKIIIAVVAVVTISLTVIFIIIRRKTRFK